MRTIVSLLQRVPDSNRCVLRSIVSPGKAGLRWNVRLTDGVPFAVPVQHVQRRDQELVGVLLLVACEVTRVSPHQVQQPEGNVGRTVARVELGARRGEWRVRMG